MTPDQMTTLIKIIVIAVVVAIIVLIILHGCMKAYDMKRQDNEYLKQMSDSINIGSIKMQLTDLELHEKDISKADNGKIDIIVVPKGYDVRKVDGHWMIFREK